MTVRNLKVLSNAQVSERYWHMVVDSSSMEEGVIPGQFFNIKCGHAMDPFLRRPFSIYRINKEERTLEFLYLVKGAGTQVMTRMAPGEPLNVLGPLGQGFTLEEGRDTILLLARGVGIATLAALAQEASAKGVKCVAILSARSGNDLLATEALQSLGAEVYKVTEEEGTSGPEHVQALIRNILKEHNIQAAYTCGSKRLSKLLQTLLREYGIPGQIALEEHMGCAMGVCYACVCDIREDHAVHSVRVCLEGPVFDLGKVVLV
jgi:dihydroorotate dehydrogenase electron transfer subunit